MKPTLITLFLAFLVFSCDNEDIPFIQDSPVVANTTGAYTYTLNARSYTRTDTDRLDFPGDSVQLSLTITNYKSGTGEMIITDADGQVLIQESLDQNKVVADANIPASGIAEITISFDDLFFHKLCVLCVPSVFSVSIFYKN